MFCENCGMEFRQEGANCAGCGLPRPFDESSLDWEEAARRREQREAAVLPAAPPVLRRISAQTQDGDSCVRPGAAQKLCTKCGRSLPASTISDLCVLCATRDSQERSDNAPARVWRNSAPIVHQPSYIEGALAILRKRSVIVGAVVFVVLVNVFIGLLFLMNLSEEKTPEPSVSVAAADADAQVLPEITEQPPALSWSEQSPLSAYTQEEVYVDFILPATDQYLAGIFPELYEEATYTGITCAPNQMDSDGDTVAYLSGQLDYTAAETAYSDDFLIGILFIDEDTFQVSFLEIDGIVYLDDEE